LDETLHSVDTQTWTNYEVHVVDDGSLIDVRPVVAGHKNVSVTRQANAGSAVARNTGIARASGDYLIFLDADDHLLSTAMATGVSQLSSHPECGFAVGPREEMTYDGQPVPWTVSPPPSGGDIYLPLLGFEWYIIPPSSAIFRRELVAQLGGFRDPWGADDLDFYLRASTQARACCYDAPAVTRYRRYSTSSSRDGARMLASVRAVYAREWHHLEAGARGEAAFAAGLTRLTDIFLDAVVENLGDRVRAGQWAGALRSAAVLARESPERLITAFHSLIANGLSGGRARPQPRPVDELAASGPAHPRQHAG
jgi:hypothetical protein